MYNIIFYSSSTQNLTNILGKSYCVSNFSKYYIVTDEDVNNLNILNFCCWLKKEKVVALSMRNLKTLKGKNSNIRLFDILQKLIQTFVLAVNFGENEEIRRCDPLNALILHIQNGGCIRRYYIDENYVTKAERRSSGLIKILAEGKRKDNDNPMRVQAGWMNYSKQEWNAIDISACSMGSYYVSKNKTK